MLKYKVLMKDLDTGNEFHFLVKAKDMREAKETAKQCFAGRNYKFLFPW